MAKPPAQPLEQVSTDDLTASLRLVINKGLPVTEGSTDEILPNLRAVYARAVVPTDRLSRIAALNELLPRLVASIDDSRYREAVQILFALASGTRGASLTERRRRIAAILGYHPDHVRDRIERQLLEAVARVIQDDLLRYRSRVKRASESLEPTGDSPALGPEHINHEEELVSRIWQHVYGLRAELIAYLRLSESAGFEAPAEDHRQAALGEQEILHNLLLEYAQTYGDDLIRHGGAEYTTSAFERLVAWRI